MSYVQSHIPMFFLVISQIWLHVHLAIHFETIQVNLEQKRKDSDVKFCLRRTPKYPLLHSILRDLVECWSLSLAYWLIK